MGPFRPFKTGHLLQIFDKEFNILVSKAKPVLQIVETRNKYLSIEI